MVRVVSSAGSVCHISDDMPIPVGWELLPAEDDVSVGKKKNS